jgi:hypothetical protein
VSKHPPAWHLNRRSSRFPGLHRALMQPSERRMLPRKPVELTDDDEVIEKALCHPGL